MSVALNGTAAKRLSSLKRAELRKGSLQLEGDRAALDEIEAAFGHHSSEFQTYAVGQLLNLVGAGGDGDCTFALKSVVAMVASIAPANEAEAMLAVQMACAHHLSATLSTRCLRADRLDTMSAYGNLATKFQRTFVAQMEALAKLRRGGEQVVRHVHVNEGGQALIAGTVNTRSGG